MKLSRLMHLLCMTISRSMSHNEACSNPPGFFLLFTLAQESGPTKCAGRGKHVPKAG